MDLVEAKQDENLDFDAFKCPSDVGYQSGIDGSNDVIFGYGADPPDWREYQDAVPCYDAMGNSYATDSTLIVTIGGAGAGDVRSFGPYLRAYSSIPNTSDVVVYKESNAFYIHFWSLLGSPDTDYAMGWHGVLREHNVAYADGFLYVRGDRDRHGILLVKASPEAYMETGRFILSGHRKSPKLTHPVIANGRLFLRDQNHLTVYSIKAE